MKEVKKIRLTDSPTAKDVKKIRLEPLSNCVDEENEKNRYDVYESLEDLYAKEKKQ